MDEDTPKKAVVKRNPLVQAYLDDLLHHQKEALAEGGEVMAVANSETHTESDKQPSGASMTEEPKVASAVEQVSAVVDLASAEEVSIGLPEAVESQETATGVVAQQGNNLVKVEAPPFPSWAEYDFDCLVFDTYGIRLAAPMERLGGIHQLDTYEKIPLFGQPDWYLGVVAIHGQKMKLIDSAVLLMPERGKRMKLDEARYAVQLNKTDWCLACHTLEDSIMIARDRVHWRAKRLHRPWFIGTLIDQMCSVIDVEALVDTLDGYVRQAQPKATKESPSTENSEPDPLSNSPNEEPGTGASS